MVMVMMMMMMAMVMMVMVIVVMGDGDDNGDDGDGDGDGDDGDGDRDVMAMVIMVITMMVMAVAMAMAVMMVMAMVMMVMIVMAMMVGDDCDDNGDDDNGGQGPEFTQNVHAIVRRIAHKMQSKIKKLLTPGRYHQASTFWGLMMWPVLSLSLRRLHQDPPARGKHLNCTMDNYCEICSAQASMSNGLVTKTPRPP